MSQVTLSQEKIELAITTLEKNSNKNVIEVFSNLAQSMSSELGQNNVINQFYDVCKTVQNHYNNDYLPSVEGQLKDFKATEEVRVYLEKRATVADVSAIDTSFAAKNVNTDRIQ